MNEGSGITRREFLSFVSGAALSTIAWNFFGVTKLFSGSTSQTATVVNSYGNSAYGGTHQ